MIISEKDASLNLMAVPNMCLGEINKANLSSNNENSTSTTSKKMQQKANGKLQTKSRKISQRKESAVIKCTNVCNAL